jgi:2-oxo-4-hydroxy-4-carboxy-5-ureidoimidazoline decarboxylase
LPESDWQEAFDSHPRLGERRAKAATAQSLNWSAGEQSAANPDDAVREALAHGNREYEEKFGRIFLLCATGRSAPEMLMILRERMQNDAVTEVREAAEQQRLITRLRLRKWLQMPALTCAELVTSMRTEAA